MDKRDFSNLGDEIRSIVQDALNSRDFTKLKKEIRYTAESTVNEVRKNIKVKYNDTKERNERINYKQEEAHTHQVVKNNNKEQTQITKKPAGSVSGILFMVFGFIGTGLFGASLIANTILSLASKTYSKFNGISFGVLFAFFLFSMLMALRGVELRKRVRRFKKYVRQLKGRTYCSIKELASHIGETEKFVAKDLRKMINLDMFPEGHIDKDGTYLMLNYEVYEHYLRSQEGFNKRREDELSSPKVEEEKAQDPSSKELKGAIEDGKRYIMKIREANDAIPEEEISKKLDRLEQVTEKIFNYVEKHPEQLPELSKLMSYYLPITLKLVNGYRELDAQPVQGENIMTAKNEIQDTLDTINTAFENLLDSLFHDMAFDISTDISVLETMLSQEGLTEKDFKK